MNHEKKTKSGTHNSENCQHQVDEFHLFNVPAFTEYSIASIEFNNSSSREYAGYKRSHKANVANAPKKRGDS